MPPWRRALFAVGAVVVVAVFALLAFLIAELGRASDQIRSLDAADLSRGRAIAALASGDDQLRAQVRAMGGTPSVPPPAQLVTGPPGPGPSDTQVQAAVDVYLAAHPPSVTAGVDQLTTVVAAYLTAHPPAPGPPPSDAQVATAVSAYMAANPPPSGPPGQAGASGPPGPSGAPGSPPAGWSWTDPSGVTYDCAPDDRQPAPHYTCTARPTPSPSPSGSGSPSASGPPPSPGPIPPATDSPKPPTKPSPTPPLPAASVTAFLQPLPPARSPSPGVPLPSGPRTGLLLLAPSYLPARRHA